MICTYLIEDYPGHPTEVWGLRQLYAGRNPGEAQRRRKLHIGYGARPDAFAIVRASSRREAFDKAIPILLRAKARNARETLDDYIARRFERSPIGRYT